MTAGGWFAVAAAVVVAGGPSGGLPRVSALARGGRLVPPPARVVRRRPVPPGARLGVLLAGVAVVAVVGGAVLGIAAAAVAAIGWRTLHQALAQRRGSTADAELSLALETLIAELEAGGRPGDALAAAAAAGRAAVFGRAAEEARRGGDPGGVLAAEPGTRPIGCAWRLAERTGAALAGVLGRVAADVAASRAHRRAVAVALAGPRSSAAVLAGLPVLGLVLGGAMRADPAHFLLRTPAGTFVGGAGVLLDAAGVLWMQRILHRAADP